MTEYKKNIEICRLSMFSVAILNLVICENTYLPKFEKSDNNRAPQPPEMFFFIKKIKSVIRKHAHLTRACCLWKVRFVCNVQIYFLRTTILRAHCFCFAEV